MFKKQRSLVVTTSAVAALLSLVGGASFFFGNVRDAVAAPELPSSGASSDVQSSDPMLATRQQIETGQLDQAEATLRSMLVSAPHNPAVYNNLAVIAMKRGQPDRALALLNEAVSTSEIYAQVSSNIDLLRGYKADLAYSKILDQAQPPKMPELALLSGSVNQVADAQGVDSSASTSDNLSAHAASSGADDGNGTPAAPQKASVSDEVAVVAAFNQWIRAWEKGDIKTYLASYTSSYKGKGHAAWVKDRRRLVTPSRRISILVKNGPVLKKNGNHSYTLSFQQIYRAGMGFKTTTKKSVAWTMEGGRWVISEERVIKSAAKRDAASTESRAKKMTDTRTSRKVTGAATASEARSGSSQPATLDATQE